MHKLTLEMPVVEGCLVEGCAYNQGHQCHAKAITIGNHAGPRCDTAYLGFGAKTSDVSRRAGIGACKTTTCLYNADLACTADGVRVGFENRLVGCLTYATP